MASGADMHRIWTAGMMAAALLVAGLGGPGLAQAPGLQATGLQGGATILAAPRLSFSDAEMALAQAVADAPLLAGYYGRYGLTPIFEGADGPARRDALIAAIAAQPAHGISPARYRPDALAQAGEGVAAEALHAKALALLISDLTGGVVRPTAVSAQIHREVRRPEMSGLIHGFVTAPDPAAYLAGLAPQAPAYAALQRALRERTGLAAIVSDLPPAPEAIWRPGMRGAGVLALRARLAAAGFATAPGEPRPGDPQLYDAALARAVARYQQAAGLPSDGVAGPRTIRHLNGGLDADARRILMAMERMRWMGGEDLGARHVWVNIPEFSARIVENGQQIFETRTVVGTADPARQTPEFSDRMEYVVMNPRWNVPRSITVKEYLPRLQANRNAVAHIDVVDGRGNVIPRANVDFGRYTAANFPYRMRQKPSDDNALGLVKFIFPNPWNIYLHDTPTKHLFAQDMRAHSHGCVRIGDPMDLARALLSPQSDDATGMVARALESGRERYLPLTPNVPVHLVYFTAYPAASGRIRFFADVYGRDAALWDLLQKAALDSGAGNG